MSVTSAIDNLKDEMQKAGIKSENGLGTELFLFSSTLIPVVNVDLLLTIQSMRFCLRGEMILTLARGGIYLVAVSALRKSSWIACKKPRLRNLVRRLSVVLSL